jgi:basic amino acid/polyamine antiporter, APA family
VEQLRSLSMAIRHPGLGVASGVGIVVATTVGAGVFVTTGFMAQSMGPSSILLAWALGAAIALAGAHAYAAVAELVPASGGEYRYLSDLLHPALGYLAGWASLLVGFAAPVAVDAYAAASYAGTLFPVRNPRLLATALIAALTILHALGHRSSRWTQDLLALAKATLLLGFVAIGLLLGKTAWPAWTPPQPRAAIATFAGSLFYVAYAFSGWNTAVYAAAEFREPRQTVRRSLLLGCAVVAVLYLLVNWIFVANLVPQRAAAVFASEGARITLAHLLVLDLLGTAGARALSILAVLVFLSAASAMTFAGPRVYAAMAQDGFLPRRLASTGGSPPAGSIFLQGLLAAVLVQTHELQQILENAGGILTLFSALTVLALFRVAFRRRGLPRPAPGALLAAAFFAASAGWMLYFGFRDSPRLLVWIGCVAGAALAAYLVTRIARRGGAAPAAVTAARTGGSTGGEGSGSRRRA